MKLLKVLALVTVLATSLTACLKDKSAETTPATDEQTMEAPAEGQPTEGQPTEVEPTDAGETQSN